jgi:hypothetical protein
MMGYPPGPEAIRAYRVDSDGLSIVPDCDLCRGGMVPTPARGDVCRRRMALNDTANAFGLLFDSH